MSGLRTEVYVKQIKLDIVINYLMLFDSKFINKNTSI